MDEQTKQYRNETARAFEAEMRIFRHGYITWRCLIPSITAAQLEAFANELDWQEFAQ